MAGENPAEVAVNAAEDNGRADEPINPGVPEAPNDEAIEGRENFMGIPERALPARYAVWRRHGLFMVSLGALLGLAVFNFSFPGFQGTVGMAINEADEYVVMPGTMDYIQYIGAPRDCRKVVNGEDEILCGIGQFKSQVIAKAEAVAIVKEGLRKWTAGDKSGDDVSAIGYDHKTGKVGWFHAAIVEMDNVWMWGLRYFGTSNEYITHFFASNELTLTQTFDDITGVDPKSYLSSVFLADGTESHRIMYVQDGKARLQSDVHGCEDVYALEEKYFRNKFTTICLRGSKFCYHSTRGAKVLLGKYVRRTMGSTYGQTHVPVWECDVDKKQCKGKMTQEEKIRVKHLLALN